MIFAPARTDHFTPIRNLSTTHRHYTTNTNLCPTTADSYRTYCNLPTAIDPLVFTTHNDLDSTAATPWGPHDNSWAAIQPLRNTGDLPAGCCRTFRPDNNLWPANTEHSHIRHPPWLDHYEPFTLLLSAIYRPAYQEIYSKKNKSFSFKLRLLPKVVSKTGALP